MSAFTRPAFHGVNGRWEAKNTMETDKRTKIKKGSTWCMFEFVLDVLARKSPITFDVYPKTVEELSMWTEDCSGRVEDNWVLEYSRKIFVQFTHSKRNTRCSDKILYIHHKEGLLPLGGNGERAMLTTLNYMAKTEKNVETG